MHRCPSSDCREGAVVFGIALPSGRIAYAADTIVANREFMEALAPSIREGTSPERLFRFSNPCVEGKCREWSGSDCGLIHELIAEHERTNGPTGEVEAEFLPHCTIRRDCRWFVQRGSTACVVCPSIITDAGPDAPPSVLRLREALASMR